MTTEKNRCPNCGKLALGKPANQRNVRCEHCWYILEMPLAEAGLDTDGNPVAVVELPPQPVLEPVVEEVQKTAGVAKAKK